MLKKELNLCVLTEQLMEQVIHYGILEVSAKQYRNVCNSIIRFAKTSGVADFSSELMMNYQDFLNQRVQAQEICPEYRRFQLRVMRMLSSLAATGQIDFTNAKSSVRKYPVSDDMESMIEEILDSYFLSDKTKNDLRGPIRHLFWYALGHGMKPELMNDSLIMKFLIEEVPLSNSGSTGRTLRCVRYVTEYLKKHGNTVLCHDYSQLKLKNAHRRIIPAYSETEIGSIAAAVNTDTALGMRDLAIILVAYCTGLRGADIVNIRLSDIDWRNQKLSVIQSKNHMPLICELNGATMNALADYVLNSRPECDIPEVFITSKAPYRKLDRHLSGMINKYCRKAGITKIAFRSFHSIRRSFETVMVSNGVAIETASQMMGHKSIEEDKPYITHDKSMAAFVAMGFADVPITAGVYAGAYADAASRKEGGADEW